MKYIFFDVDGTLLDNRSMSIPESTIMALNILKDKGLKLVICSGRGIGGVREIEALNCIKWDGYVTYNGAICYDENLNIISEYCFTEQMIKDIDKVSDEYDQVIFFQGYERWINKPLNAMAIKGFEFFTKEVTYPVIKYDGQKIHMAAAFNDTFEMYEGIPGITVLGTDVYYADLIRSDVHKGTGVKAFINYYHLDKKDTMAFGDGINDVEMLESVGVSVAMGQGRDEAKAVSTYVTTAVYDDGIYNALKHFKMI